MKRIFIALTFLASVLTASAYSKHSSGGLKIGAGGGFYSTWLFNTNVSNIGDDINYKSSTGGQFGVSMTYDFEENTGMASGIFYSGHSQKYDLSKGLGEATTSLSYIDIPVLFRAGNLSQGFYFEIGPQVGILTGAKEDLVIPSFAAFSYTGKNVKSEFSGLNLAGVIGFGGIFDLSDNMAMSAGLRMGWAFTDATVQRTEAELKVLDAADASSFTNESGSFKYTSEKVNGFTVSKKVYDYKATNRAFGGLFVSLLFKIQ